MSDIVGIGAAVMDTLITLPEYPAEDTKLRADGLIPAGGGPTATGIVAAAKLGAKCDFIGNLSDDNAGSFLLGDFKKYGVGTDLIDIISGYRSFTSCIWLSKKSSTRTCVFDKGDLPELELSQKQIKAIESAKLLMVDGNELGAAVEAARVAGESGTKVLYDAGGLYEGVELLLPFADILIPSEEFAMGHTGEKDAASAARKLFDMYSPEVVVVTCGKKGGIMFDGKDITEYSAFKVDAVDTNGAGDVFHGAFAAAVAMGYTYDKCCVFSSAVSALKCTGFGARESTPNLDTVKDFLRRNGYEL